MMLTAFYDRVGEDRLKVAASRGLDFHEILTMASIVEREAVLDDERPLIAGVYQNRLSPKKWPTRLLQSDPTIFYVHDTLKLADMKIPDWTKYVFWDSLPDGYRLPKPLPDAIAGYNTYTSRGLPPGPDRQPGDRVDRRGARTRTRRRATCSSSRRATAAGRPPSRRRTPSTTRTSRSTARTDVSGSPTGGLPEAADFAPAARRADPSALDRGRPRPLGPTRLRRAPRAHGRRGRRRLLRDAPGAHALADRVHARRGRGEGRRPLGPVPRRAGRGDRPHGLAGTRSRRGARRPTPSSTRSATPCPRRGPGCWRGSARGASPRGRGRVPRACGRGSRPRRPTSSSSRSTAGSRPMRAGQGRPTRSSGSRPRAPSPTARWRRCCRRSGRASPSTTSPSRLEWLIRTGGAEALAFDVACLAGPEAALPARLARRPARARRARSSCSTSGPRSTGYRSDMTRTLFVGEPTAARPRDLRPRRARAQQAAIDGLEALRRPAERRCPIGRDARRARPRRSSTPTGAGRHYGHGLGHGIGLATHELPAARAAGARASRCRARRCSRSSRGSTSRARPGSGSRTSSTSTPRRRHRRAADALPDAT